MARTIPANKAVLVLNQNYEPLNVCNLRRAIVLVLKGKAETLENGRGGYRSAEALFDLPSVIRLGHMIKRPMLPTRLSRREVFVRDKHFCQYCQKQVSNLTLDHVVPRRAGGVHSWENVVSACVPCNLRKAGRTPEQAGMKLLRKPIRPPSRRYRDLGPYLSTREEWRKFVPA